MMMPWLHKRIPRGGDDGDGQTLGGSCTEIHITNKHTHRLHYTYITNTTTMTATKTTTLDDVNDNVDEDDKLRRYPSHCFYFDIPHNI